MWRLWILLERRMLACSASLFAEGSGIHLSSLVLGDLVLGVLVALLALAVRLAGLGNVDLMGRTRQLVFVKLL